MYFQRFLSNSVRATLLAALTADLFAARAAETPQAPAVPTKWEIQAYERALAYDDPDTALVQLHRLLAMAPEQAARWQQEMIRLYLLTNRPASALHACEALLHAHEGKEVPLAMQEQLALCQEQADRLAQALQQWQKIRQEHADSPLPLLQSLRLQLRQGSWEEAAKLLPVAVKAAASQKGTITYPKDTPGGRDQVVSFAAAAEYLTGKYHSSAPERDHEKARAAFQKALKLSPEFELARRDLAMLPPLLAKDTSSATKAAISAPVVMPDVNKQESDERADSAPAKTSQRKGTVSPSKRNR